MASGLLMFVLLLFAGGRPSRGTPKDKRLSENKPQPKPAPPKKGK